MTWKQVWRFIWRTSYIEHDTETGRTRWRASAPFIRIKGRIK